MGQPKRKHSKQRSRKRRGANRFQEPQLAKEADGTLIAHTASILRLVSIVAGKFLM